MIRAEVVVAAMNGGGESLPALITRAAQALASAKSSAEVLDAKDYASLAFDVAKKAERVAKARKAHDEVVAAALRAQSDALIIEGKAKARLADEFSAEQAEGNAGQRTGRPKVVPDPNDFIPPSAAKLGLSRKLIMEGRRIMAAEERNPGIIERTLNAAVERGEPPTRAMIERAVTSEMTPSEKLDLKGEIELAALNAKEDEREFKQLRAAYNKARPGARAMFRHWISVQK